MTDKKWAYEDLEIGLVLDLGSKTVTAEEIVEFAREFDPQPMHLDEAAGKAGILGGLSASGWHTCSIYMRMVCDAFILQSTSEGAPGMASSGAFLLQALKASDEASEMAMAMEVCFSVMRRSPFRPWKESSEPGPV